MPSINQIEKIEQLNKLDEIATRQIRNVTVAIVAVVVARNVSQAVSMSAVDVARRLVDLKMPFKWGSAV